MQRSFVVSLLLLGCGDLDFGTTESDVIGGELTLPGEFPGVGALMYDFGGGSPMAGCTGTLIAPDAVLTAAHCLDPDLVGPVMPSFTLALDTKAGPLEVVPARQTFKHELFTLDGVSGEGLQEAHDVGIVLLAQPITSVAPVPMPRPVDSPEILAGTDMQIVGYGQTSDTSDAGVMFDAQTKLVTLNDTEIQVGMGSPQPQNCHGDSGGPGFATVGGKRRVIGIVSRSFTASAGCSTGGIDTRVDAYLDFIHEKVPMGIPCDSGMSEACPPPPGGGGDDDGGGCCSIGGNNGSRGAPGAAVLGMFLGLVLLRRRR